ncbi:MAG: hypothetical protein ABIQ10_10520 [Gemmatimonadaceae bacterium]
MSDEVDRFPRVRRRHTTMRLAPDGSITHLEMDIRTPSEPSNEQLRHVVADLAIDKAASPVEKFTISIDPTDARKGTLVIEWGTFRWSAPIVVQ